MYFKLALRSAGPDKWQGRIVTVNLLIQFLVGIYGIRTLTYYFAPQFSALIQFWCAGCITVPWIMLLASALWRFRGRKKSLARYLSLAGLIDIPEILFVGFLPIMKMRFSFSFIDGWLY